MRPANLTARKAGSRLRPHVKTHRMATVAARLRQAGAEGICCAKVGEAEAFADAGFDDIFIANQVVGASRLIRLVELAERTRLAVGVDHAQHVQSLGAAFASGEAREGWVLSGFRYGVLQVSLVPAMLFATRHIRRRREALWAGALTGPIAIIPGVLFLVAMAGQYPGIVDRPVPANYLLELLGSRGFQIAFQVVLLGTLIESGTGVIHAFNERVAGVFAAREAHMPPALRPAVAVLLLILAALLSRFGIIDLIATGYGALSWAFLFIFVLPLLTIGIYRLRRYGAGERGGSA